MPTFKDSIATATPKYVTVDNENERACRIGDVRDGTLFFFYAIIIMTKRAGLLYNQKKLTGGEEQR